MNITKLNYTDRDFKLLINSYLKIIIFSVIIDWDIDKKELKTLFTLFTKVDIDSDNVALEKFNYIWDIYFWKNNLLDIDSWHFEYVRVLALENIIFYEWEKSITSLFDYLNEKNKLTFEEKMDELEKNLLILKKIIDKRIGILWKVYVKIFYYWLYYYVELIAKQAWRILEGQITKEEKKYLDKIKTYLEIAKNLSNSDIYKLRTPLLDL